MARHLCPTLPCFHRFPIPPFTTIAAIVASPKSILTAFIPLHSSTRTPNIPAWVSERGSIPLASPTALKHAFPPP